MDKNSNKNSQEPTSISSASIIEMIVDFVLEFKWILILAAFAIGLSSIIISLICHCYCGDSELSSYSTATSSATSSLSYPQKAMVKPNKSTSSLKSSSSSSSKRESNKSRMKKSSTRSERRENDLNMNVNHPNDYYMVLIEKD